jgi:hypothetical protein
MSVERLPDFALDDGRSLGREFAALGLGSYREAARYVRSLPYGKNTDRSDWRLVLREGRGACSTKHALLTELAHENGRHVALMLGIYEMCEDNTPGIRAVLERHGLPCIPDAHCYLAHEGTHVDLTREIEGAKHIKRFLHEEEIYARQIGEYKVRAHRGSFAVGRWSEGETPNESGGSGKVASPPWNVGHGSSNASSRPGRRTSP